MNELIDNNISLFETNSFFIKGISVNDIPLWLHPYVYSIVKGGYHSLISIVSNEVEKGKYKLLNGVIFTFNNDSGLFSIIDS